MINHLVRQRPLLALAGLATAAVTLAGCGSAVTAVSTPVSPSAQGLGSGIVYDAQGDIITNNHVVANSNSFRVVLAGGKQYAAKPLGTFGPDDLAVLHVNATGLRRSASPSRGTPCTTSPVSSSHTGR
jgi:S1-C subfamily serine protease